MVSVRRYCSSLLAMFVLFACAPAKQAPAPESQPRSFTPKQYSVEDFYKNTAFQGASWAPDKSKVLVSSDASGIWNAYAIPAQGGEPQALTNSTKDTIVADSYFPADERILYSSDQGGNELTHVYVRNPDGTTKDLTPGAKLKANFIGWAGDDKSFLVSTNERDARYFDVYEIGTDGYKRTLLYKNTDGYDIGPVSRDKRYVALIKSRTTSDADIFLFDRTSNTTKNITAHTGNVSNLPAAFSPDSLRLMFLSDSGREFASLRSHDIASGMQKTVFEPQWDVQSAQYSKAGKYLVVSVNEDARPHDVVLDASTSAPVSLPGMPQGIVQGMSISADDSAVAFYATDGSVPTDLYAGNFASAPRRLTNALNPSISREDMVAPERVRFKSYDGLEIPGVLYRPHQASPQTKVPAIVRVHGGPGGQAQVGFSPLSQAMANHGYAVFDINNRGSSGYGKTFYAMDDRKHGEADLGDVVASKQMLIDTGYVETNSIGIFGGSYGGYMVLAALTLKPGVFKVGVDMFGISNWIRTLENTPAWWGSFRDALFAEMGDPKTDRERLTRISPLFHADNINVPLMVLQGANDPRVLKTESDDIVAAAKKNGVPVSYVVFPDEGHGFVKKENEIRGYTAVLAFLDEHLRNGQQAVGK